MSFNAENPELETHQHHNRVEFSGQFAKSSGRYDGLRDVPTIVSMLIEKERWFQLREDVRMEVVETIVEYVVIGRKIGSTELRRSGAVSVRIGDLLVPRALFLKRGSEWGMETLKRLMGCGGEVDEYVNRISKHTTFLRDNEKEQNDDRT